jgi:hypothetical protein
MQYIIYSVVGCRGFLSSKRGSFQIIYLLNNLKMMFINLFIYWNEHKVERYLLGK